MRVFQATSVTCLWMDGQTDGWMQGQTDNDGEGIHM